MNIMGRIRLYHAVLVVVTLLAYFTGGYKYALHSWLGYGVLAIIVFRLLWALFSDDRMLGLSRFKPKFKEIKLSNILTQPATAKFLMLGIAVCLIITVVTGVMLDRGRVFGFESIELFSSATVKRLIYEIHGTFAGLFLTFAVLHGVHHFVYKRSYAKFMMYIPESDENIK